MARAGHGSHTERGALSDAHTELVVAQQAGSGLAGQYKLLAALGNPMVLRDFFACSSSADDIMRPKVSPMGWTPIPGKTRRAATREDKATTTERFNCDDGCALCLLRTTEMPLARRAAN